MQSRQAPQQADFRRDSGNDPFLFLPSDVLAHRRGGRATTGVFTGRAVRPYLSIYLLYSSRASTSAADTLGAGMFCKCARSASPGLLVKSVRTEALATVQVAGTTRRRRKQRLAARLERGSRSAEVFGLARGCRRRHGAFGVEVKQANVRF